MKYLIEKTLLLCSCLLTLPLFGMEEKKRTINQVVAASAIDQAQQRNCCSCINIEELKEGFAGVGGCCGMVRFVIKYDKIAQEAENAEQCCCDCTGCLLYCGKEPFPGLRSSKVVHFERTFGGYPCICNNALNKLAQFCAFCCWGIKE